MPNICLDCQDLISNTQHEAHMLLSVLSSLPNSQLYKCSLCKTYLHRFDKHWEVLIEGKGLSQPVDNLPLFKLSANR